ncbi:MAG: hypothetical protein H0Z38_09510, partial [Firmicutes bacterium]|nr:hypothetical protein [Bacillota bacterium]
MELILAALGVAFIIAALVVAKIQGQNYLRLQERTLERAQEAGLYELQAAADDLTRQLEAE